MGLGPRDNENPYIEACHMPWWGPAAKPPGPSTLCGYNTRDNENPYVEACQVPCWGPASKPPGPSTICG